MGRPSSNPHNIASHAKSLRWARSLNQRRRMWPNIAFSASGPELFLIAPGAFATTIGLSAPRSPTFLGIQQGSHGSRKGPSTWVAGGDLGAEFVFGICQLSLRHLLAPHRQSKSSPRPQSQRRPSPYYTGSALGGPANPPKNTNGRRRMVLTPASTSSPGSKSKALCENMCFCSV